MRGESPITVDLDGLTLHSGEAARIDLELDPRPPVVGGETLTLPEKPVEARIDVSRTSSGYALRLRADVMVEGTCARCLEPARLSVSIDAREVDQRSADDSELRSPYVEENVLDAGSWLHDALRLALPERLLCREDCAGLCEICGLALNDIDPAEHRHERPPDPRFAKLSELIE
jgi:DUF177 domain-containing protein